MSSRIESYQVPSGLSGGDWRRAVVQARRFGVEILSAEATAVLEGPYRFLKLADGAEVVVTPCWLPPAYSGASWTLQGSNV